MPSSTHSRINPVIAAIEGFDRPEDVCGIVPTGVQWLYPADVKYFGYYDQCKRVLHEYPNCRIVTNLKNLI